VIAYHAFPEWVPGGFTGVDIFFVISGYLISTILFENLEAGRFSFTEFYARRARRIFPALALVLAFSLGLGWFALLPAEYGRLGAHVAGGAGFVANLQLWSESGYFDTAAESKPLLHLWSLGIEEQFYLVWPLCLWLAGRRRWNSLGLILLVAAISFGWNLRQSQVDAVADFYSPLTRFWELLSGAALAYAFFKSSSATRGPGDTPSGGGHSEARLHGAGIAGVLLIALSLVFVSRGNPFPGWRAALPTAGAALLIHAGPRSVVNRWLLASRPMVWVGLISYPLYLWHWPLLAFGRIVASQPPGPAWRVAAMGAAVALAWLTYVVVEKPLRTGGRLRAKALVVAALVAAMGVCGGLVQYLDGLPGRAVTKVNPRMSTGEDGDTVIGMNYVCGLSSAQQPTFEFCRTDPRGGIRFALVGDSKASVLFPGLVRRSVDGGRWLYIGGNTSEDVSPVPVVSDDPIYRRHQAAARTALAAVAANPQIEVVLLVGATRKLFDLDTDTSIEGLRATQHAPAARSGVEAAVEILLAAGKKVVLYVDNPTLPHPEDCLGRRTPFASLDVILGVHANPSCELPLQRHRMLSEPYRQVLDEVAAAHPGKVFVFDPAPELCGGEDAICRPFADGRMLYRYSDHISDFAAGRIAGRLDPFMASIAALP
jgi:peptidoglycan/LPS O-acetylase OafA/YrhL